MPFGIMASILHLVTAQSLQLSEPKSYPIRQQEDRYSWDLQVEAKIKPSFIFKWKYKLWSLKGTFFQYSATQYPCTFNAAVSTELAVQALCQLLKTPSRNQDIRCSLQEKYKYIMFQKLQALSYP